jgi:dihydroorotate dehydrogenase
VPDLHAFSKPLLFRLPPEAAHRLAVRGLRVVGSLFQVPDACKNPKLSKKVFGLTFPNPVGLAAGFDKQAELVDVWPRLGFGFVELGTFTAKAQPGNPKPRIFRLKPQAALINKMGFNNPGAGEAARRLKHFKDSGRWPACPVGINLGKSKVTPLEEAVDDYLFSLQQLKPYADYLVVNVSSPNTPGLRSLQESKPLKKLLSAVVKGAGRVPVLLKLAPDLTDPALKQAADTALSCRCAGLIATNTTLDRLVLGSKLGWPEGGLSGRPLLARSTEVLALLSKFTRGKIPLIGVGGILDAQDAKEKLEAGASLIQLYTGFVYRGPKLVEEICGALG